LSGRGLCDELITRPEESYRLWCVVVCDLETSRIGAPYIYDISNLRVKIPFFFDMTASIGEWIPKFRGNPIPSSSSWWSQTNVKARVGLIDPWRCRYYILSKRWGPTTHWRSFKLQKKRNFQLHCCKNVRTFKKDLIRVWYLVVSL